MLFNVTTMSLCISWIIYPTNFAICIHSYFLFLRKNHVGCLSNQNIPIWAFLRKKMLFPTRPRKLTLGSFLSWNQEVLPSICPRLFCCARISIVVFNAVGVSYLSTLKYVADKHDAVDMYNLRTLFGFHYTQFTATKKILHEYLWFFIVNSINRFHPIKPALIGWYLSSTSSIIINDVLVC